MIPEEAKLSVRSRAYVEPGVTCTPLGKLTKYQSPLGIPKPPGIEKSTEATTAPPIPPESIFAVIGVGAPLVTKILIAKATREV